MPWRLDVAAECVILSGGKDWSIGQRRYEFCTFWFPLILASVKIATLRGLLLVLSGQLLHGLHVAFLLLYSDSEGGWLLAVAATPGLTSSTTWFCRWRWYPIGTMGWQRLLRRDSGKT